MSKVQLPHYDIVKKLIGPIGSIGSSGIDEERFENLKATIELMDRLLDDLNVVASNIDRPEASIKKAAEHTLKFLSTIHLS